MIASAESRRVEYGGDLVSAAGDEALEIALFGSPAFRYRGRTLRLALPRNALRLLAHLLLEREVKSRERIAFALWPDDDEAGARANLRRHLHLVQRALPTPPAPAPWILADTTSLSWNASAPVRFDVAAFEDACGAGGDPEAAVALYRGELLAGWDDEWLQSRRERTRTLVTNALGALVSSLRCRRMPDRALVCAQRLRELDPWREDTLREVMALRYESGDRSGALAEFERFTAEVAVELGVAPMPETRALYEALVEDRGIASPRTAPAPARTPDEPRERWPFVGRAAERARLDDAWARVRDGAGEMIVVHGEAGVGKSRLLEEFATQIVAQAGRTMIGRTSPVESIPLQAFADALRSALPLLRAIDVAPECLGILCTLVPQLAVERPGLPEPPVLSAPQERSRLYDAVTTVLAALADVRPVLLVLEDLHWAGASTLALLEYVARRIPSSRILLVATYREEATPRTHALRDLRRRLEAERLVRPLAVGALDSEAIRDLLARVLDEPPQRCAAIAAELFRRSDGNAFFLHEMLRACARAGSLDVERRRWEDDVGLSRLPIPENLAAWLRERIERLPAHARTVVEVAATAGRTFSLELVRDVSGIDERCILDALDRLIDERIVREQGTHGDFGFSHALVRSAVYDALPEPVRRRRHRRVASVLEQLYPERRTELAIELADHYDSGEEPQRAAAYYALGASRAAAVFANHEAVGHVRRGLELSDDPALRLTLLQLAETLYGRLGERVPQRATIARLVALATALRDTDALADALHRRVELERACGDRDAEQEALTALGVTRFG